MSIRTLVAAAILVIAGAPALVSAGTLQSTTTSSAPMQSSMANHGDMQANDHHGPTASDMNRASLESSRMRQQSVSRYERDRRAYRMAIASQRHHRAMNRYNRRYIRQQTAYAAAMASWRRQVRACHHGNHRACRAHTPRVASFY